MRVSDEDRRRVVDELRRHCAAGRIDVDEYASRIERALGASSFEELDQVRADLPMLRIAEPAGVRTGRRRAKSAGTLEPSNDPGGERAWTRVGTDTRLQALLLAVVSVAVVMAAIVIGLLAEWTWSIVIIVAWAVGLVQGRVSRRRRH